MSPSAEPLIPSSKNNKSEIENAWAFKVCNQTDNLETDSKTLYYRLLKLKMQSFYIFKAQKRLKQICIFKQQPQKSHGMDNYSTKKSSNRSITLCILRDACHELFCIFRDFYASGTQDTEVTKSLKVPTSSLQKLIAPITVQL